MTESTRDGRAEVPVPVAQPGRGTTNPGSASVEAEAPSGHGTDDLRAKLIEDLRGALVREPEEVGETGVDQWGVDQWYVSEDVVECNTEPLLAVLARGLLAAGWRPPLPTQPEGPSPWDAYVLAYREYQETDPHGAAAHPTAHHMHALGAALRVAGSPLPDSETEPDAMQWGYREHVGEGVDPVREEYARFRAQDEHLKLVQREVRFGPWIEVPRD